HPPGGSHLRIQTDPERLHATRPGRIRVAPRRPPRAPREPTHHRRAQKSRRRRTKGVQRGELRAALRGPLNTVSASWGLWNVFLQKASTPDAPLGAPPIRKTFQE